MIKKNVSIGKGVGTDTRPGEKKVNVKSIMGLMTLSFAEGLNIMLEADGEDEAEAVEAISAYLANS